MKSDQLKRDIDVIRNIGSNRGKPSLPNVGPLDEQSRSNIFKSLEPMDVVRYGHHSKPVTPNSAVLIKETNRDLRTREPHVIMIDLDINKKNSRVQPNQLIKDVKPATYLSPQIDMNGGQSRKELFIIQGSKSNSIQHQSNKVSGGNNAVGASVFVPHTRMAY